jgi:isopentenyl diphosphate isomerase/L-lactate dehydrogenase-like FMN-dependent dehydrogenase
MYINKDREITMTLINMAELYGFRGVVITVDAQVLGKRISDIKNGFSSP